MRKTIVALAAIVATTSLAGCGKMTEPYHDADRSDVTNNDPADVGTMPDGFSNYATKCDHGHRVYVLFHSDSKYGGIAVVDDEGCAATYAGK